MTSSASQGVRARAAQRDRHRKTGHRGITYRQNSGGRVYFVYDGAQRKKGRSPYVRAGKTLNAALALQAEIRARRARGERLVLASKRTVRELGEAWFEAERSRWRGDYARELRRNLDREIFPEFGDDRVTSLGPREIIAFDRKLRAREKKLRARDDKKPRARLSASAAANIQKPLRGLLDHAVLAGDIAVNPYRQVPRAKLSSCSTKRQHHSWTTEELERFIATAHKLDERPEARRAYGDHVELMVRLGLRIGEASGLRFSDVDHAAKVVRVRRQFTKRGAVVEFTKTSAGNRRIPVTGELLERLALRQSFHGLAPDDFVFAEQPGGKPPTHGNFRRRGWNRVVAATGLELDEGVKVTPHDARHATASQLAELGLDEEDGAALLGHTSGRVTRAIYTHAFDRDKREARIRDAMERAQNGGG
jgi:integrase